MKYFTTLLLLAAAAMLAVEAYVPPVQKPHPNQPHFPSFPGQGPFNPRPHHPHHRLVRSPKHHHGQVSVDAKKEGGKTSWNVQGQHNIYENKHGSIHVNGGASKQPGGKPQGNIGIGGTFHWG